MSEPSQKRNCWTCKHSAVGGLCMFLARSNDIATTDATFAWIEAADLDSADMPPQDADGCPGYEFSDEWQHKPEIKP